MKEVVTCGSASAQLGMRRQIVGMQRREFGEQLLGIQTHFARDRTNDRSAVDAVGEAGQAVPFEQINCADGQLGSLRYLALRQPFMFAGQSQTRSRIERAMVGHCFENLTLVV